MLNLSALKNVLTGIIPAPPSESPPTTPTVQASDADAIAAQVQLKQTRRGQTRTAAEQARAKVEAAHKELILTQRVDADEDSTAVMQRMTRAEEAVRDTEKELLIAVRMDEAAQHDLQDAEQAVELAIDHEVVTRFKAAAKKMETLLSGEMTLAADELGAALRAVQNISNGDTGVASSLRDILGWFPIYRDRATAALIPSGKTYSKVLDEQQRPFSAWADNVEYAMKFRRKG